MDFKIRNATDSDFNELFDLLKQLWPDLDLDFQALNEIYLKAIDSELQRLIVGEINEKIVGFCSLTIKNNLWQAGNLGHVDELVIDKVFRGKGYGKKRLIQSPRLLKI
jgi:glucosamine-phosphate N-acetyltransferase